MLNWYVVKTKNNKKEFAKQNLINQNFQVYLPIVKTIKKFGNKLITVKKALFPNYIFVKIDFNLNNWSKINNTRGVSSIVNLSLDSKSPVSESDILNLKSSEDQDNFIIISKIQKLTFGRLYKILEGPFQGHEAMFNGKRDKNNIFLNMSLLGRNIRLNLPYNCVEPI